MPKLLKYFSVFAAILVVAMSYYYWPFSSESFTYDRQLLTPDRLQEALRRESIGHGEWTFEPRYGYQFEDDDGKETQGGYVVFKKGVRKLKRWNRYDISHFPSYKRGAYKSTWYPDTVLIQNIFGTLNIDSVLAQYYEASTQLYRCNVYAIHTWTDSLPRTFTTFDRQAFQYGFEEDVEDVPLESREKLRYSTDSTLWILHVKSFE